MQGSAGVKGMFLDIDESMGTIAAMNGDPDHETECFGSASYGGETNYISMKGRGNSTWSGFDKKPYNITFYKTNDYKGDKKKVELIDDTKTKKWSLLANAKDPTGLRNKIGNDIAAALGIGLPSESVDVWMNGDYLGNYLLTPKNDYQAPDDGYMVEIDNLVDVDQFTLTNSPKFTVKEMANGLTVDDVKASVSKAWDAIRQSDSDTYLDYIDLDSWAKMYLLNELYKDVDVSAGSIFFTKATMNDSDKLVAGPVWDLDGTLGRVGESWVNVDRTYEKTAEDWYIDGISDDKAPFFQVLGKHPGFMRRVYELYNEYKTAFDGIPADLDAQSTLIAASGDMNLARWPQYATNMKHYSVAEDHTKYGSDAYAVTYQKTDSWAAYTGNLKEYVTKRLAFLSDNLTVAVPTGSITGVTALAAGDLLTLTADCTAGSYRWQSSADGKTWQDIDGATGKTYSVPATLAMDGLALRCVAKNTGATVINTTRVAKAAPAAVTLLSPVTLTVKAEGHVHHYQTEVTQPTCTEKGYTTYTCSCGDSYKADYTDAKGHDFRAGQCIRCPEKDPDAFPQCVTRKVVSLTAGQLLFTLGGTDLGEYTFAKSGSGWSIRGTNGKYLGFTGGAFAYSDSPFAWSYSDGRFTTSVTTTSSGGILGWLFGSRKTTTYVATIAATATGTTVSKVEYSTNGGAGWTSGNTVTSDSVIGPFLIRVTDGSGTVHRYQYNGTAVIAQ